MRLNDFLSEYRILDSKSFFFSCRTLQHYVLQNFILVSLEKSDVHLFLLLLKLNYWDSSPPLEFFFFFIPGNFTNMSSTKPSHVPFQYSVGSFCMKTWDSSLPYTIYLMIFSIYSPLGYSLRQRLELLVLFFVFTWSFALYSVSIACLGTSVFCALQLYAFNSSIYPFFFNLEKL